MQEVLSLFDRGHGVATETKAVRAAIGATGQFASVDDLLTGAGVLHWPRARDRRALASSAAVACLGSSVGDSRIAKAALDFELQSRIALHYKV